MALANYTDLQTAIASWHHRSESQIADFITLAEKRINNLLQSRMSETEATLAGVVDSRYIALPTGYMTAHQLWLTEYGERKPIIYITPEELPVIEDSTGQPTYYTIDGSNIAFNYANDIAYSYVFRYKKGYDLASTTTNSVMTNHPAVYLYGAMKEASNFAEDDAATAKYEVFFQQAIQEAQRSEYDSRQNAILMMDGAIVGRPRNNILSGDF